MKKRDAATLPLPGTTTTSASIDRLIVRHCGNAHPHICDYFVRKLGFSDLCRLRQNSGSKSKAAHIRDLVGDFVYALRNLRRIRRAQEIVTMGPMACNIAFLLRLRLLPHCRRAYCFGLFIHSPRWLCRLRPAFTALAS